jgi:1,4-alpha-glucan branching enzyme
VGKGSYYKYYIKSKLYNIDLEKADPFARRAEMPPGTASIVWDTDYNWQDTAWMETRHQYNSHKAPFSVYEVHLGSWLRRSDKKDDYYSYYEIADKLVPYVQELGFTHVELMPLMGFPFDGSWGYQVVSYFACAAFFGEPQGLMYLIDAFHKANIGVIMDWVPSHFPGDGHGLIRFDGTALYEHEDPRKGFHPDWKSYIFNYGCNEVTAFLIRSALFWLDKYHFDGLRVDAVASIIYLDFSRKEGEWTPNKYGGNENLEGITFVQDFNKAVYRDFPDVQTIAEESTAYPKVSHPVHEGGLGFGMKWMMGWMHDTFKYFALDPLFKKFHHNQITFSLTYAFTESFMLPISHDEVVHGKASLVYKLPGNEHEKFDNLRVLLAYMYTHPGAKLLFMGTEFGQTTEWNYQSSLPWHLLEHKLHNGVWQLVKDLNALYVHEKALYVNQFNGDGFEWMVADDWQHSVLAYVRKDYPALLLVVLNMTPVVRPNYRVPVPVNAKLRLLLNTDDEKYAGHDYLKHHHLDVTEPVLAEDVPCIHQKFSVNLNLPPMSVQIWRIEEIKNLPDLDAI